MGDLNGKVALITGGAKGQGAAEAELFVREGARVVVADLLDELGEDLATRLGTCAAYLSLDVADEEAWEVAVARTIRLFGRLDILVNNAGVYYRAPVGNTAASDYINVFRVNQLGVFLGMRAAVPAMRAGGGGSIVNISSTAGLVGPAGMIAYAASKWAVRGMTKVAAAELGPDNIRVNSVHPGLIDTDMIRHDLTEEGRTGYLARLPLRRAGVPAEVAELVLFLASERSGYSTGSEFVCDGGFTAT